MTDKQIASSWLLNRLSGIIPDHDVLRDIADQQLTEERCYRIVERIIEMCEKIRRPLVDYLNRYGVDTF